MDKNHPARTVKRDDLTVGEQSRRPAHVHYPRHANFSRDHRTVRQHPAQFQNEAT